MKKANRFKVLAAAAAVVLLFTSCGLAAPRKSSSSPVVRKSDETPAATDAVQTDAATNGESGQETTTAGSSGSSGGAGALSNGTFLVNVNGLKAVSAADPFPIKVESTRAVEDAFSGYSYEGNDAIGITVRNDTDKIIKGLTIHVCCYDSADYYVEVNAGGAVYAQQTIYSTYEWSDMNLAPGESTEIGARLKNAEEIAGIQAIVASYTAADGEKVENGTVAAWAAKIPA
ncbi:MAG: hypothetical protein IJU96_02350 [Clostridia bacterium]|nr:hypothetical protein [Clostridia bacterium]